MNTTTNYELKKPSSTDNVNIDDLNYNVDKIDIELKNLNDNKQPKTDTTLNTTSKTIPEAINELSSSLSEKASKESLNATNENLSNAIKTKTNITILATGWVDDTATSGFYIYDIADADITITTVVDVNIKLADIEKASDIKSSNESFDGYVRLYADVAPAENIICDLRLTKAVV